MVEGAASLCKWSRGSPSGNSGPGQRGKGKKELSRDEGTEQLGLCLEKGASDRTNV